MTWLDSFLFIALPYVAAATLVIGMIGRYMRRGYTVSSLSSQFLEGRVGFWGTVPFHIAILALLLFHLVIFLFPDAVLRWNSDPIRLLIHEGVAFTFGVIVVVALALLLLRRWLHPRLRSVTSRMDVAVELLLFVQVVLGCSRALGYRWGSSWFASDLSPYLWSIVKLNPDIEAVAALPLVIKLHVAGAYVIVLMIPFTRLAHMMVAPLHYLWRPYQVVMWHWDRKSIRQPTTAWQAKRPQNN